MPTLALSMIVRNAERDLADCLQSARAVVDEIIVTDTGSRDSTIEIARNAGARVVSIPWENDFAKARNLSLAEVSSDWVLVLDADERLDRNAETLLPALLVNPRVAGYQVTLRNYVTSLTSRVWDRPARRNDSSYLPARIYPAYIDHENVRLFRRHPEIYFTGRVHETVGWRILSGKRGIGNSGLIIHHMGMVRDSTERARKNLFYLGLGKQKAVEMPDNSQAHFELGLSQLENSGDVRDGLVSFERACDLNPQFGISWFFRGLCHFRLDEFRRALECFLQANAVGHSTAWLTEMMGDSHYNLGSYSTARDCYRQALKHDPSSALLESKLGLAEARTGEHNKGLRRLRRAIEGDPANGELYDRLIMVELWLNRLAEGAETAEQKLKAISPEAQDFLRAASIRSKMQQYRQAAEILRQGVALFPDSEPLRSNLNQVETVAGSPPVSLQKE
jgi:tetratricopeptide (TPR) repeat protein